MHARFVVPCAGAFAAALLLLSCEPPGRPPEHPAQAENREAISDFKTLFQSNCSGCHGDDGKLGPARILNDTLYLAIIPRQTLRDIIANGRPGTAMPAWGKSYGGPLTDKQINILVDGMYSNWGHGIKAPNDAPAYADNTGGDPANGKKLFLRSCFMCHGKGMKIGTVSSPEFLQLVSNQMLRTSIIVGRLDLGMPPYRFLKMGKPLTNQDVTDIVAYLNSLRTSPAPGTFNAPGGEQASPTGPHQNEDGTGQRGPIVKGNEGSGFGPGSPTHHAHEGNKGKGSESERGVK